MCPSKFYYHEFLIVPGLWLILLFSAIIPSLLYNLYFILSDTWFEASDKRLRVRILDLECRISAGFRNEYPSFEIIDLIVWYHFKFTPIQMFDKFMNFMKIQNKQKQQKTTNHKYSNKTCVRNKLDSN